MSFSKGLELFNYLCISINDSSFIKDNREGMDFLPHSIIYSIESPSPSLTDFLFFLTDFRLSISYSKMLRKFLVVIFLTMVLEKISAINCLKSSSSQAVTLCHCNFNFPSCFQKYPFFNHFVSSHSDTLLCPISTW